MNRLILGIALLAVLVAFGAPASATCPCVTIDTDTIDGGIYYRTFNSWEGTSTGTGRIATHTFTDVPAGVTIARVHTGVWMLGSGSVEITVNGVASDPRAASGTCDCNAINDPDMHDYCTGYGVDFITYDATEDIPSGGGDVTVTVESINPDDGRLYMIALLVVYEDASMPSMTYWINEGARFSPTTTYFDGPYSEADVTDVTYWTLGAPHGIDDGNGNAFLNTNDIGHWDYHEGGSYYDFYRWDAIDPDYLNEPNDQMYHPTAEGNDRLDAAVLRLWRDPLELPDLIVTDIGFDPETPRPDQAFTVTATIKNVGSASAGASTATLYIDDVSSGSIGVSALGIGNSETVSFTGVNLPGDCYDFKVVADSGGVIDESDETNNGRNEDHQVGYVIIVESDGDFAALAADIGMPTGSVMYDSGTDTYYIQDLTITNCAGDGISIQGTTKNFIIKDCTIENCASGGSGVFLNDVTKGTITECTLQNNEAYGVELGLVPLDSTDPERINITCNTIYQNGVNGIDLIGFDCIVKDNTVRDNAIYGIYLYGDDNKICNNIIKENDDYGAKLYNSSGNYVYWNNFANNNGGGVQGCDNRVTNTWNQVNKEYPYHTIHTSCTGNYWDDHTAPDTGSDGIVDTLYALDGGVGAEDSYPMVTLPWIFDITIYNGKNLIGIPLIQGDPCGDPVGSLSALFGSNPVNWDKVRRWDPVEQEYNTAQYFGGTWYDTEGVEPIELGQGYWYVRQGTGFTLEVVGTRKCNPHETVKIYGSNFNRTEIAYANFTTNTDLSTFDCGAPNCPVNWDKVRRYDAVNQMYYTTAQYVGGVWYDAEDVEPITAGVGYEYVRNGPTYYWTYLT